MFFNEVKSQSLIKKEIVVKYFDAWAKIMNKRSDRLGYIDLFSGPGNYEDGTDSTPIAIMKLILKNNDYRNKLHQ
jgi:three-Cys-motif partner protein